MSDIIDFTKAKQARAEDKEAEQGEWAEGPCVCLGCRHEWVGVAPPGRMRNLVCPSCELPKGTNKHPFGAAVGDMTLTCAHCGGEALTAYARAGHHYVRCMGCGVDLTEVFFYVS